MTIFTSFFLFFLVIQLFFWVGIFGRFTFFFCSPLSYSTTPKRPVSVLICARNEAENLEKFLPLWLNQNYENYEVVVINDCSTDNTASILAEFVQKYPHFRFLTIKTKPENYDGKKYAITQGMQLVKHDIVLLTDADCYPKSADNLRQRVSQFDESTQFVLGYSPYEFESSLLNFLIQYETLYTALQYFSMAFVGNPYMAVGRNLGYRRQLFLEKKGFNNYEYMTGGDDDLFVNQEANKKNTQLIINPDSQVISIPEKTWQDWLHQKKRHLSAGKSYRLRDKIWLAGLFFSQFGFWICFFGGLFLFFLGTEHQIFLNLGGFFIRQVIVGIVWSRFAQRVVNQLALKFVFVLEFLYILYYLYTGIISLISKQIAWKIKNDDSFRKKH